jgi:hypothetical protein
MWIIECTPERPWGIHPRVHNDQHCPRCGWAAPGPLSDALEAQEPPAISIENDAEGEESRPLAA